jgi:hypothetical protein
VSSTMQLIVFSLVLLISSSALAICPDGWIDGESFGCYLLETTNELSWDDAFNKCKDQDAQLAEVYNKEMNDFILSIIVDWTCMGGTDQYSEGEWRWATSGKEVVFEDWAGSEPDGGTAENNMFFRPTGWYDAAAYSVGHYLCQKIQTECPTGWTLVGDKKCVMLVESHGEVDWIAAGNECKNVLNSTLAEIRSQEVDNIIALLLEAKGSSDGYWIGAADIMQEGIFQWFYTGDDLFYDNWAPGQPDDGGAVDIFEDCVMMSKSANYMWTDEICNKSAMPICMITL